MSPPWELMALAAEGREGAAAVPSSAHKGLAASAWCAADMANRRSQNKQRPEVEDDQDVGPTCHCKGR
jgi:hypothetical protein